MRWFGLMGVLVGALTHSTAVAQEPSDAWRTVRTEHARIHYPVSAEPFALEVATEFESIRTLVIDEVGYAPPQVLDVVIRDPISSANGMAIPFLRGPKLELWASPPDARSVIGHYDAWSRLLVVHEMAHQVHLLRPTRNGLESLLSRLIGVGPLSWKSPRWVAEGYATVIEGRLTGFGRPNGDFRATFLRTLAREGMLPTYGELDGSSRFLGGAYAYLVGSAYLEWLQAEQGEERFQDLWARMSSRQSRTFEEAFTGVYGAGPRELYGRYTAELTADAMAVEAVLAERDPLWAELSGAVGPVAIDVQRDRAAAVVVRNRRATLTVWELADNTEAQERWAERVEDTLARDPLDVAPTPPESFAPKRVNTRTQRIPSPISQAFVADGTVLFTGAQVDGSGRRRTDLYIWDPDTGRERRITHGADLRDAVPEASGGWAVAMQNDFGLTHIVRVDLNSGAIVPLVTGDSRTVLGAPALSPDGRTMVYAAHRGNGWQVESYDVARGTTAVLSRPPGTTAITPSFSADGAYVLATVTRAGLLEAWRIPIDDGPPELLASPPGGALAPVETPDGDLIYASLRADGYDLYRGPLQVMDDLPEPPNNLAVRPDPPTDVPEFERAELAESTRYGLGRWTVRPGAGGAGGAGTSTATLGLAASDLIDRTQVLLQGGLRAEHGTDGLSLQVASRALSWFDVQGHGYVVREVYDASRFDRAGAELMLRRRRTLPAGEWSIALSGLADGGIGPDTSGDRFIGSGEATLAMRGRKKGSLGLGLRLRRDLGRTNDQGWDRSIAAGQLVWGRSFQVAVSGERGFSSAESDIDRYRLGGLVTGLLPDGVEANRVHSGAFAPGLITGRQTGRLRVEARTFMAAYAERLWVWDDASADGAFSSVGLSIDRPTPELPLIGMPNGHLEGGLACRLETPSAGWDERPCQELSDYAAWLGLSWRP